MLHAVERIEELTEDPDLLREHIRARAGLNRNQGVGCCEAPRGTLFHHYEVDDDGLMRKANLLIATSQNNLAMNRAVEQAARQFVPPQSAGRHVEPRRGGDSMLRSVPFVLDARAGADAADRRAAGRVAGLVAAGGEGRMKSAGPPAL